MIVVRPGLALASALAFALALVGAAAPPAARAAPPAQGSPMAQLKRSNHELEQLLRKKVAPASPDEQAQKEEVKRLVNAFLDFRELARRALAKHWEGLTEAQRTEFVGVLRDLIERSYVKQLRGSLDYDVAYEREELRGDEATVHTVIRARRKGREVHTAVDYEMRRLEGRWVVFDVITDEVSLVRNYRSQFNKIISRDGYAGLLKKMKKKLEEG